MKFAPPIIEARKRASLSQRDLARELGVSARAVWLTENGGGTIKVLSPILDRLRIGVTGLPPARDLGGRIRAARSKRGWSRQELADRSGLSLPTLRGLERNMGRVRSVEAAIQALAPTARERRHYRPKPRTASTSNSGVGSTVAKLLPGDCLEIMPTLEPRSVALVVTSPPYNSGKSYEQDLSLTEYERFAEEWVSCIPRLLTDKGALWINLGYTKLSPTQALPLTYLYYPLVREHGLHIVQELVWHYEGGLTYMERFAHRTERWMWFVRDPENFTFHLDDVRDPTLNRTADRRNNAAGKNPTDLWYFDRVVGGRRPSRDKGAHPCQFPVAMVERIVRACSDPGEVVLDPFGGSGSTALAAQENGRGFISIERDVAYHEAAVARLAVGTR